MSNNSNSNSNNSNSNPDYDVKRRQEDMALFQRFRTVATAKLERMTSQVEKSDNPYQMGEEEKQILTQMHGMGLKEGVAAGVVTFLILRRGPIYIGRYIMKRNPMNNTTTTTTTTNPGSSGGYQLSNPNAATKNPFQQAANPQFPRSRNRFFRAIWFTFDATLSLMMAANVSVQYTDASKMRQKISELPLVPGKSLVSDALCEELSAELQKVIAEQNPSYKRLLRESKQGLEAKSPLAFYMQGITSFCENCQRRAYREQELRQEQGLSSLEQVEIPAPGVPRDGPRLIKNSQDGSEQAIMDESHFGDSSFGDDLDGSADWASNLVKDQNEDSRRKP
jgi:hypothetical protein